MNDCETIILEELRDVKKDVKNLLLDVNSLKVKSAMWGMIGGFIFTIFTIVIPLIWKSIDTPKAAASQTYQVLDTTKIHVDPIH